MLFDGICVNAVISFRDFTACRPIEGKTVALILFEPLIILDEIELELRGQPRGELEGNIAVRIGSTITTGTGLDAYDVCRLNLFLRSEDKAVASSRFSKLVEIDQFKILIKKLFPRS